MHIVNVVLGFYLFCILLPVVKAQPTQMKLVLFGDERLGGEDNGLAAILKERLSAEGVPTEVVSAIKAGDASSTALGRMQREVVIQRPDVVLISFGTYDALIEPGKLQANVSLAQYRQSLGQMLRFLKEIKITPILICPPPQGKFWPGNPRGYDREPYRSAGVNFLLKPYADACRELAESERIPYLDMYQDWITARGGEAQVETWLTEGSLPNIEGIGRMAELLLPLLKQELSPVFTDVFVGGNEGYQTYRIPSTVVSKSGILLAFCEGRAALGDQSENDIVLKRSFDNGKSWQPLQVIAQDGAASMNNPQAAVDPATGRIWLMYQRYPAGTTEKTAVPGVKGENVCQVFVAWSDDEGYGWSEAEDITKDVKPKDATSIASGPGIGITLESGEHQGRIVMPMNQGPYGEWKVYMAYTDDQGKKWKMGKPAPVKGSGLPNEVQILEKSDGTLLMNARNIGGNKHRKWAISKDGGDSWSEVADDPFLIEPECQASIFKFSSSYMLFSNPASIERREMGTLRLSEDQGTSWKYSKVIYPGSFAYSCLTKLSNDQIGVLFERDDYGKITFARLSLKWLMVK